MSLKRRKFISLGSFSFINFINSGSIKSGSIKFGPAYLASSITTFNRPIFASELQSQISSKDRSNKNDLLLRFISVADTGTGGDGQYSVAQSMINYRRQNPYNLVILAGDNIYTNGEIEKINSVFERPYASLLKQGIKFYSVLGNHDIRTANGEPQVKYFGFNMQGRYYTFYHGSVQFFALDTNHNADWQNQLIWLEKELSNSKAIWKIVFGHHQIYSSGVYGVNKPFIDVLTPLFQKYGVQLYINGHEHNYERTRPINGTTYMVCGGGANTRPVGRSEWTEYSASKLSFAAYNVYADRIEISGIGTDNEVFDRGVIPLNSGHLQVNSRLI
ncbi:MAG: metallophosphoesterase [Mastigocoleus sp. MO_167.B18]|uniref:metallophosphoesterase family protein n=1 Tax=Mastigocoleus sp. MO_188.B34 TaxID=3036635 RepID=UPI0026385CC6|nr:metallophosphoesterase [Mastigocoleus sp. MO_188.B34]MDJ0694872.1 metallophosphoesterase [Mastigocoleus sp. MO_188.B34]MDJ0773571.1 metallophosphoesterase [Mastigocoleus sp. MO_167.B18]